MKNEFDKEKVNLLTRLYAKFHNTKVYKTLLGLTLAACISNSLVACDEIFPVLPDTQDNTTQNQQQNPNNSSTYQDYSQLLQNILNNEHYNNLIESGNDGNEGIYNSGEFKPHPYAFLEKEGIDVNAIKNGEMDCYTMSYVLNKEPNNLYMYTRVDTGSYIMNYLLKYQLTDQEMDDYDMLHCENKTLAIYYIQAYFMNNEISKMKTPVVVGTSKMTYSAFENMTDTMCENNWNETKNSDIIMINPSQEDRSFRLITIPRFVIRENIAFHSYITDLTCRSTLDFQGDLFHGPDTYGAFKVTEITEHDATFYFTQKGNFSKTYCSSLLD